MLRVSLRGSVTCRLLVLQRSTLNVQGVRERACGWQQSQYGPSSTAASKNWRKRPCSFRAGYWTDGVECERPQQQQRDSAQFLSIVYWEDITCARASSVVASLQDPPLAHARVCVCVCVCVCEILQRQEKLQFSTWPKNDSKYRNIFFFSLSLSVSQNW